jgi:hypothetical protein
VSDVLLAILLIAPLIDWATVAMLAFVSHAAPEVRSLRERLLVAVAIATGTTVIAALVIDARWLHVEVPKDVSAVAIVAAIVAPSAINALWLYRGWKGTL